ncbi:MAG: hypothetical protein WD045_05995 [Pirellulaceae bacterium]
MTLYQFPAHLGGARYPGASRFIFGDPSAQLTMPTKATKIARQPSIRQKPALPKADQPILLYPIEFGSKLKDGFVHFPFDVSEYAIFFIPGQDIAQGTQKLTREARGGSYRVIFVNGMGGHPAKFRAQACAVAAVTGGPVTGVYNHGENLLADFIQCITDKWWSADFLDLEGDQQTIERNAYRKLHKSNKAAGSLFKVLLRPEYKNARIVAHSQGNIITANAVNALAKVRGKKAISDLRIHAVASPVLNWSEAGSLGQKIVTSHVFGNDFIAWLGFNLSSRMELGALRPIPRSGEAWEGTEVTGSYEKSWTPNQLLTHNFYAYLEKLWEELRGHADFQ